MIAIDIKKPAGISLGSLKGVLAPAALGIIEYLNAEIITVLVPVIHRANPKPANDENKYPSYIVSHYLDESAVMERARSSRKEIVGSKIKHVWVSQNIEHPLCEKTNITVERNPRKPSLTEVDFSYQGTEERFGIMGHEPGRPNYLRLIGLDEKGTTPATGVYITFVEVEYKLR